MQNLSWLFSLCILALFIWLRDLSWLSSAADTLPILCALPLFIWLGSPWKFHKEPIAYIPKETFWFIGLFLFGILTNVTLFLAVAWTGLLWIWISKRCERESLPRIKKLMILPFMAFPWVTLDAQTIGWWFRLSGAWATGCLFSFLGFDVYSHGTTLAINGLPINVEAACAGLNTLQSMLIAGSFLAYIYLGNSDRYWYNLPFLVLIAWVANTARIITISLIALSVSTEFAMGAFHTWGGLIVLISMFGLSLLIFSFQEPQKIAKI